MDPGSAARLRIASGWRSCPPARCRWTDFRWSTARFATKMNMFSRQRRRWTGLLDAPLANYFLRAHASAGRIHHCVTIKWACCTSSRLADTPSSTLAIEPGTTYLLNPGSVGQPRDGDARAAFAIADIDNNSVEFWRVPYDIEAVQTRMTAAGTAGSAGTQAFIRPLRQQETDGTGRNLVP